jgi:mycothiol synthase
MVRTDASPAAPASGATGLVLRPYAGEADLPDIVRLLNAQYEADGINERRSVEGERAWYAHVSEQFDPARDVVLGELDGRAVGVAGQDWVDTRDGAFREFRLWGAVDPAYRRRGIGRALLADNERRARRLVTAQRPDRSGMLGSFAAEGRPAAILLEQAGYTRERWFFDMVRPTLDDLPEIPLPDGFELRPVTPSEHEVIWRANREAFRDHWGGADESLEQMRRILDDPDTDTSLWLIAWDGVEVAGGVWNAIYPSENETLGIRRGWLDSVFTRRAWRRRGLARALIARSLRLLRDRGMTSAALGVDADNPTGALGLYTAAGFAVDERFAAWRKPMEPER